VNSQSVEFHRRTNTSRLPARRIAGVRHGRMTGSPPMRWPPAVFFSSCRPRPAAAGAPPLAEFDRVGRLLEDGGVRARFAINSISPKRCAARARRRINHQAKSPDIIMVAMMRTMTISSSVKPAAFLHVLAVDVILRMFKASSPILMISGSFLSMAPGYR